MPVVQAVDREDYDEAKRLKAAIDRLRGAGSKIAALEAKKKGAVDSEDYDLAKELKQEIDRMRSRVYAAVLAGESSGGELGGGGGSEAALRRGRGSVADGEASARRRSGALSEEGGNGRGVAARPATESSPVGRASLPQQQQKDPWGALQSGDAPQQQEQQQQEQQRLQRGPPSPNDWSNYDERPAVAKGTYDFSAAQAASPVPAAASSRRTSSRSGGEDSGAAGRGGGSSPAAPPGFPSDLPAPEPLSPADAKDADDLPEVVGEFLTRCLFSKEWQLRAAALQHLAGELGGGGGALGARLEGDAGPLRTLCHLLARTLADKMVAVFTASVVLLRALVLTGGGGGGGSSKDGAAAAVWALLPVLVDRAAELNARIRELACEVGWAGFPAVRWRGGALGVAKQSEVCGAGLLERCHGLHPALWPAPAVQGSAPAPTVAALIHMLVPGGPAGPAGPGPPGQHARAEPGQPGTAVPAALQAQPHSQDGCGQVGWWWWWGGDRAGGPG